MSTRSPLPEPFANEPFRVARALAQGVGEERLRNSRLRRPFHGVRVERGGVPDAALAYSARMPPTQYFSHWTAAELHGLPVPRQPRDIHVTSHAPGRAPRLAGVVGHTGTPCPTVLVRGLRVSTPVRTWIAMSTELGLRDLVILGDALVRRQRPLATMDQLAAGVLAHRGKRGAAALTEAFARVRARTDSVKETELRLAIVDFGLPEPSVNVKIFDRRGRLVAIGDLVYEEYRIIPEYDGEQHRLDPGQFFRDVDRREDLAELEFRIIQFNRSHISPARLASLRRALLAAGWKP